MNKKTIFKTLSLVLAVILAVSGIAGGTIAWLMTQTASVENTFTYGDINIEIDETGKVPVDPEDSSKGYTNEFEMLPGRELAKDPKITVKADSEACWLFVKLEKDGGVKDTEGETVYGFDDFLTYEVASPWKPLLDANNKAIEGVYYIDMPELLPEDEGGVDNTIAVLKDDKVTVKSTVTKEMLNALDQSANGSKYPKLTVTGYAIQKEGMQDALAAWLEINSTTP